MRRLLLLLVIAGAALAVVSTTAGEPRDSVGRMFPVYANGGQADLTVDPQRFTSQMSIVDRYFAPEACELTPEEGPSVGGTGYRRLLRFDVVLINGGDGTLVVGSPTDPANQYHEWFVFSPCHNHYHIAQFADYRLLRASDRSPAAFGHKQAFCLISGFKYTNDYNGQEKPAFTCADQGIQSGWGDWYYKQLSGQWIDITGVPEGDYIVRVTINTAGTFPEGENRYPNVIEAPIHVPDPRNKVTVETTPLSYNG